MSTPEHHSLRHRVALALDPELRRRQGLSPANRVILGLILLSVVSGVLGTEPLVTQGRERLFFAIEAVLLVAFTVEYLARLWVAPEARGHPSRLRWMLRFDSLLDLAVILSMLLPFLGAESALLRLLRAFRLVQLARLGRYSRALSLVGETLRERRAELVISLAVTLGLMLLSSTLLFIFEGPHQPEAFGSIPRAMWWAVATLTTVGYGDVVPLTALGKFFAALTALTGVAVIALPTGIVAGAFAEAMERHRK
ncbi:voltage-gated potassium channel [Meinhardsimonia xiamenensis]|jgi:voltage-gated potassium channel|uniref:Voltage-gated potassium channel n=1 Tax=Meinhardsimonia xiamenensis TaxID=990712 RepID=A0A1G9G1X0_9RHOB|nr:ion transporter [Meinhardsimonia xiamenensis]PRX32714.1 voltage-gated potassium channel [Meinhardsimonia xiamenensis]SDK94654.1 voltage-gated potassium channel [Meinhardsimonia xiamenensis]